MQSSTEQAMGTYQELMQRLVELPTLIAEAEGYLGDYRRNAVVERRMLDTIGAAIVDEAIARLDGDIKRFGSSEDVRKANAARLKGQHHGYQTQERMAEASEIDVQRQQVLVDDLNRQYGAIGHQVRLTAALWNYLGSAGVPVDRGAVFTMPVMTAAFTSGNGSTMTAADAEAAGF